MLDFGKKQGKFSCQVYINSENRKKTARAPECQRRFFTFAALFATHNSAQNGRHSKFARQRILHPVYFYGIILLDGLDPHALFPQRGG